MSRRAQRLSEEIKREVSDILRNGVKDPRVNPLISITQVQVSRDLSYARIYVSLFGSEKAKKDALEGLERARGFVRRELGGRLKLRNVPEVSFLVDDSIEYGSHINQLLKKVMNDEETGKHNDAD
ncbi:MAG: 30S ribosome-binding factor RbfA [Bacillota bacterium]|jgi:ribosome-binding factor A|nr:30S ribosome-binding factor RbfA [Bacillota bacterium]MDD3297291.1 30S ribosome-binding factor RbfA [Bacillota bacterium]MDD3850792.1 30S ribosome-binding factor RbfA [Bacillota bacterium]MDD4706807.1 30S ribosome-binding factor RbfA [Bacillota bacterium]